MPGWHAATKKLAAAGEIQVLGIIPEQHPERCRLFMQWKQMDWPILVDSFNAFEVTVVPATLGIDEHGVVRRVPRDPAGLKEAFLDKSFPAPAARNAARLIPRGAELSSKRMQQADARGDYEKLIRQLEKLLGPDPSEPAKAQYHFELGVAHRMRYDSHFRAGGDFQTAVEHWQTALDANPNQYIWRRRIQQFGPRLDKPYPFYDWVGQAQKEVAARGETPVELRVELTGSEIASRGTFAPAAGASKEPDAEGRITRDAAPLVLVESTIAPPYVKPGRTTRVHLTFTPSKSARGHWNNEAGPMAVWIDPPDGWQVDRRAFELVKPPQIVSEETRRIEFELRCPKGAQRGEVTLAGYALYYVCEDADGKCLYRRQDISVAVRVGR